MSQKLEQIAQHLHDADKKVQLIYGFNGAGKTRLSQALKELVAPQAEDGDEAELSREKILYYNAFTEDLFYWDNDLLSDGEPKLMIQPNTFTDWILVDQGQETNITRNFQRYVNDKLTPTFNEEYTVQTQDELGQDREVVVRAFSEVTFSIEAGGDEETGNFKISKGEESNFVWSIFYTLLEEVISVLNIAEVGDRPTDQFNRLQYVFVDDPVSSLDENHLIELAVNLADLIKAAPQELKFVVTTHSPLFYNLLHNKLGLNEKSKNDGCYLLERLDDGTFNLNVKYGGANKSFSYHLHLKDVLEKAIASNAVERFHFTLIRNLYEKTAGFLGYKQWSDLLDTVEGSKNAYVKAINTFTHSALSSEQAPHPSLAEKNIVKLLLENLLNNYAYWQEGENNG